MLLSSFAHRKPLNAGARMQMGLPVASSPLLLLDRSPQSHGTSRAVTCGTRKLLAHIARAPAGSKPACRTRPSDFERPVFLVAWM